MCPLTGGTAKPEGTLTTKVKRARRWRIYYGDNSTFSSLDGQPWDAPAIDAQVIVYEQTGKPPLKVRKGNEAYIWREEIGWVGVDNYGVMDYLFHFVGPKAVLFGRAILDDEYQSIERRAREEGIG